MQDHTNVMLDRLTRVRLRHAAGLAITLLLASTGQAQGTGAPPAAPKGVAAATSGAQVYSTTCAACHQADGAGVAGQYPPLARSEFVTGSEQRLILIVLHGLVGDIEVEGEPYNGAMPGWGASLADAQVAAVLTYIRGAFGNTAPAVMASTVARVRAAVSTRTTPYTVGELTRVPVVRP
ncbi:MAG: cytochrome c [Gemmatimonadota bacterium]